jgi:hypothetical protein
MHRTRRKTVFIVGCVLALLTALYGGRSDGWWEEDVGLFTISLPSDMKGEAGWGTDSFGGEYSNPAMRLSFDSGQYAPSFAGGGNDWPKSGTIQETTIHARPARIGWAPSTFGNYSYQMMAYFPRRERETTLSVFIQYRSEQDRATARKILESVKSRPNGTPRTPSVWQRFRRWLHL